ncbi:MAG: ATP-binding protein [Thermoanaerobaculia bacterium]
MKSRLFLRLLWVTLLVLALPVAGIWSLGVFERELLSAEERTIAGQAHALAAALASEATLSPEVSRGLIERVGRPLAGRIRIFDGSGGTLADTAAASMDATREAESSSVRDSWIYRIGATLWRWRQSLVGNGGRERTPADARGDALPLARALSGSYGALTRPSVDGRTTILTVAVPIRGGGGALPRGAVVVSRSTETVLAALDRIRVDLFRIVLISIAGAALIVFLLARGLVVPLRRLRDSADGVLSRPGSGRIRFPGADRRDEIGDLARSLGELNRRLEARLDELEAFASDVAHELRNPLATVRSAAELLLPIGGEDERRALTQRISGEVRRMDRVVGALQDLARLDAARRSDLAVATELGDLVRDIAGAYGALPANAGAIEVLTAGECWISVPPEAAARVVENLLRNALSFSPENAKVHLSVRNLEGRVELAVVDSGPGVPAEHRARVFERFFSWRPGQPASDHLGLGLGIVRAIVERYGGSVALQETPFETGARFVVQWPGSARPPA